MFRPLGGPRWSWDRLGSVLFSSCGLGSLFVTLLSSDRLGALLAPFWAPKWPPGDRRFSRQLGPWGIPDRLGTVLVRSFFRLAVWDRLFDPLKLLSASFWRALGGRFGPLRVIFGPLGLHFWVSEVVLGPL